MAVNLVGKGDATTESLKSLACGFVYGVTSPLIGHPIDTVKTQMQAGSASGGALATARRLVGAGGVRALYAGLLPPLAGSSVFRSVQFSAYAFAYAAQAPTEVPGTGGLQVRVLTAGFASSLARALIETPLEYVKVRQQMAKAVLGDAPGAPGGLGVGAGVAREVARAYTGFGVTLARTYGLMSTFFITVDYLERKHPSVLAVPLLGPFIKGAVCSSLGWIVVWPFEVLKSQIQAGTPGVRPGAGLLERAQWVVATRGGVAGLYRGIGPGLTRSLVANGASMIALTQCQVLLMG